MPKNPKENSTTTRENSTTRENKENPENPENKENLENLENKKKESTRRKNKPLIEKSQVNKREKSLANKRNTFPELDPRKNLIKKNLTKNPMKENLVLNPNPEKSKRPTTTLTNLKPLDLNLTLKTIPISPLSVENL